MFTKPNSSVIEYYLTYFEYAMEFIHLLRGSLS